MYFAILDSKWSFGLALVHIPFIYSNKKLLSIKIVVFSDRTSGWNLPGQVDKEK